VCRATVLFPTTHMSRLTHQNAIFARNLSERGELCCGKCIPHPSLIHPNSLIKNRDRVKYHISGNFPTDDTTHLPKNSLPPPRSVLQTNFRRARDLQTWAEHVWGDAAHYQLPSAEIVYRFRKAYAAFVHLGQNAAKREYAFPVYRCTARHTLAICAYTISTPRRKNISNRFSRSRAMPFYMTFFGLPQPVFRSFFDHLFSRQIKTAELSPVKIGTDMHTTTIHLSAFVEPNKSSGGPRNSLLCTKKTTPKTTKTPCRPLTTPADLLRLHGISPSALGHLPKPSGPGF
jgi:hypothetical protein